MSKYLSPEMDTKEKISALIVEKFICRYADELLEGCFEQLFETGNMSQLSIIYSQFLQAKDGEEGQPI